jgi:hypothetical protein
MSEPDLPQGAIVIIDETQPGRLKLSDQPYDTRVAGIISGGASILPLLGGEGRGEGERVSLTALTAPIKPGDLLTTPDTPGHCMKATDRERAYGTVIGKAMTSLPEGKGLVLVLVSLQ